MLLAAEQRRRSDATVAVTGPGSEAELELEPLPPQGTGKSYSG